MEERGDSRAGCIISQKFNASITVSKGWRIWAPMVNTNKALGAEIEELKLYENFDCSGPAINMTGTPVESGNRGEGFGADNAFQSEGSWDGKADEFGNIWVGQVFDNDVTASCMTVKFGAKFMKTLRVQALIDDEWRNVMINSNGSTGVVSTNWNGPLDALSSL